MIYRHFIVIALVGLTAAGAASTTGTTLLNERIRQTSLVLPGLNDVDALAVAGLLRLNLPLNESRGEPEDGLSAAKEPAQL